MAQLVASMSGVVLGGVVEVVGSNLAKGEIFTASIGLVDLLYLPVFICCVNLHQFLILCSSKALMFLHFWYLSNFTCILSFHLRMNKMRCIKTGPIYDVYCISYRQYQCFLNILFLYLSGTAGRVDVWCSAIGVVEVVGSNFAKGEMYGSR